jgi:hypothetical protein
MPCQASPDASKTASENCAPGPFPKQNLTSQIESTTSYDGRSISMWTESEIGLRQRLVPCPIPRGTGARKSKSLSLDREKS